MIGLLLWTLKRIVIDLSVLTIFFLLAPGLPPHNATFSSYSVTPALPLSDALEPNGKLDSAEQMFVGKFSGPESIAWKTHDEIFLSIHGGTIIKIFGKGFERIARVTRIGPPCAGPWQEKICGRPLGLRFAPDGKLLVADAYYGIFSVNVETGEKECLISPDQEIDGKPFKLANDLDVDSDGNIYWSDSSFIADLSDGALAMAADPTGRLLKYDPATGSNEVLLKDIHFANGVQLSSNQDFIVLAETARYRIHRYWLKGEMAGRSDIFLDGLPGMPDNIRPRPDGGFYVSLVKPRLAEENNPFEYAIENIPVLRKLLSRVLCVAQWIVDGINKVFPHEILERTSFNVLNLGPLMTVFKSNISIVVEVDVEGKILGSLQGSTGNIPLISETAHVGDNLFFGSPHNKFLGRLYVGSAVVEDLPQLFEVIGEGITMKKPKDDNEIEKDETETPKDEQVNEIEIDNNEKVEGKELEKIIEQEETEGNNQADNIKDHKVQEPQESEHGDSIKEQKAEIIQDVKTVEAEITEEESVNLTPEEFKNTLEEKAEVENAGEMPVDEMKEDFTHLVEEVITNIVEKGVDIDDSSKEENTIAVETVEEVSSVDSEVMEEDIIDEKNTADVVKEPTITVDTVSKIGSVDSEVTREVIADAESPVDENQFVQVTQNVEDDVAQVEDEELQQIEELIVEEQTHQNLEQNEESKEVKENKDEL